MSRKSLALTERYPAPLVVPIVDILAIVLSGFIAHGMRFGNFQLHDRYVLAITVMALSAVLLNNLMDAYSRWRITSLFTLLGRLAMAWFIVGVLAASIIYFAHVAERYSRLWIGLTLILSYAMAGGARILAQLVLRRARIKGMARRSVFLVGPGHNLVDVARGMRSAAGEGYSIAGVERFSKPPDETLLNRLARRVEASGAREVWICVPLEMGSVVRAIFYALRNHTAELRFVPDFRDMHLLNHRMSEVAGRFAIDLSVSPMSGVARIVKRLEDIVIGSLITLIIALPCIAIAIGIKMTSSGPVLFKQYRTGVNGKQFKVYKFRSMEVHEERTGIVTQATKGDPRVTRLGAFLRRTSLDELPQFYNVLQGRMSIVGPRPHALAHNEYYKELVQSYMWRHKVKPGITGWAQVNGLRGETDTLEKMERRVEYDLWYIDNWSLWLDLRIIFLTIIKGFSHQNAY
ncbi:undecaprenyl-phosphate glucose phosphotransferase [Pistricoccus aurantiacus]|uniref:Undecaprenyl-phosphate glucose phosphotransferase n=1 Tax=Pistricoccus aurantiacus TaxID=1883414 RepID=A0A5B8SUA8_9GAMM|nr:undecaprenyl-phosphate glucose phosphotransferase [Pistricoccus aurantiacus]QEA39597.1 undecaprenyl-phosphate glucose phosphotransferase [Pistricoccus aurantiacus]